MNNNLGDLNTSNDFISWQDISSIPDITDPPQKYCPSPNKPVIQPKKFLNLKILLTQNSPINLPTDLPKSSALFLASPKISLTSSTEYRNQILQQIGSQILYDFQKNNKKIFLSPSYNFKKVGNIIHCVLPKFSKSFSKSSLDSLHFSYRELFEICLENDIKNVVITEDMINPPFENGFNINKTIEILLRTLRKILESFYLNFDKIIFAFKNELFINRLFFFLKIYFPRSEEEQKISSQYLPNYPIGDFGDLNVNYHLPKIKETIQDNKNFNMDSLYNYNDLNGLSFFQENMNDDLKRINKVYEDKKYFYKKFYYENLKDFSNEIKSKMEDLHFLNFKGTDMENRQIYFFYLKLINFENLEKLKVENLFIIYCINFFKENFQPGKKFSLIFFCNDLEKCNLPSKDLLEIMQKIILSLIGLNVLDFKDIQIIFFLPDFFFKMFINFLKIFLKSEIEESIQVIETYEEINEEFYFELDEESEKRINDRLPMNENYYFEMKDILEARNDLIIPEN